MAATLFICSSESGLGFEHDHMVQLARQQEEEHNLEVDLAIALELDPFEVVEVALEDAFWCEMHYHQPATEDNDS